MIVDNASDDYSPDGLDDIDLPLSFLKNTENRGFAAACNQGANGSNADYLLFLNPDTVLFEESLAKPLDFMECQENRDIGILGIQLIDEKENVSRSCARFPTPMLFFSKALGLDLMLPHIFKSHFMKEWDHMNSRLVNQVMGAFFLVRHPLFKRLGGFDELFFVYFEEVDLSLRAKKQGLSSYYFTEAQAYHKGGGSTEEVKALRLFYSLRSRILYFFKHFSLIKSTFVLFITLFVEPIVRIVFSAIKLSGKGIVETLMGYVLLWRDLPNYLKKIKKT